MLDLDVEKSAFDKGRFEAENMPLSARAIMERRMLLVALQIATFVFLALALAGAIRTSTRVTDAKHPRYDYRADGRFRQSL